MSGLNDRNWKSYGPDDSGRTIGPADWVAPTADLLPNLDDLFKVSNSNDLTAVGLDIPASANEDSVDAVRFENFRMLNCIVRGSITLKGAGWKFLFKECVIWGTLEIGKYDNYWYPGRPPTQNGLLDRVTTGTESELKVVLWDATEPLFVATRAHVVKMPKIIWLPYFLSQYVWVRLVNLFLPPERKHKTK